ncbi:hypothetical protein lerEdw1_000597 [Lerista edwardsae]|nr:hypothetical protein lerEdw1_000597 [Lerista edwardsae]
MDGHILRKTQNMLCLYLVILLGEIPGGIAVSFVGFPGTGTVIEHSPNNTVVYSFNISLSKSPVASGFPVIINSNPLTKAFSINCEPTLTCKVVTTGKPTLDYETMPSQFDLQLLVYDTAGASDLQILKIQVLRSKEPPVIQGNMADQTVIVYILETKRPVNPIYQIHAADSEKGPLNYSLGSAPGPFSVSSTGTVSSLKDFDSETDPPYYVLNITVINNLGLSTTGTLIVNIINVNDESPYFIMNKSVFRIPEESTPGTPITTISAKDPDDRDGFTSLRYSISNPRGIPDFYINPVTGAILVARRIDREAMTNPNTSLIISVTDSPSGGHRNQTTIVIIIEDENDNPPECTGYNFRWVIPETETTKTVINLKANCKDIDAEPPNNWFNFTELSGAGSEKFTQDPAGSGRIKLIGNFDPENGSMTSYSLTTQVNDVVAPYYANTIYLYFKIIPVNGFAPVFSNLSYVFNVSEIAAVNSQIGKVSATDKDLPSAEISYSIVGGGFTHYYSDIFWIHPKEGIIKLLGTLDYETKPRYTLTVQASDNEGKNTTISVIVNVLEVNDEKPDCSTSSSSLAVPVDTASGTNIDGLTIRCTDRDSSPQSFIYSIGSGNVNNHFTFSPNAGCNVSRLILALPFDYKSGFDKVWDYTLKVFITDNNLLSATDRAGVHVQTGTVTIAIKVIPNPTTVAPTTMCIITFEQLTLFDNLRDEPGITIVTSRKNVYFASAWYVPFIICLGVLLLLGFLAYLLYLLAKYIRAHCPPKPKAEKKPLIKMPEKKKAKKEVVWEMTNINTVFDGEARDPVTGKWYEFNSKSGARRWKDTKAPSQEEAKKPVAQVTTAPPASKSQGNLNEKDTDTSDRKLEGSNSKRPKPSEKKKPEISGQDTTLKLQKPKEETTVKRPAPPIPPHRSPIPTPKIYPSLPPKPILKNEV